MSTKKAKITAVFADGTTITRRTARPYVCAWRATRADRPGGGSAGFSCQPAGHAKEAERYARAGYTVEYAIEVKR